MLPNEPTNSPSFNDKIALIRNTRVPKKPAIPVAKNFHHGKGISGYMALSSNEAMPLASSRMGVGDWTGLSSRSGARCNSVVREPPTFQAFMRKNLTAQAAIPSQPILDSIRVRDDLVPYCRGCPGAGTAAIGVPSEPFPKIWLFL